MPSPSGAEGAPRLLLIGTVHRADSGLAELRPILEEIRPAIITLEMSSYALDYRLTRAPQLHQRLTDILAHLAAESGLPACELAAHPAVTGIRELLDLPYEYRAAADQAEKSGAALELIDLSEISVLKLRRVEEELVTEDNLRILLSVPDLLSSGEGLGVARTMVFGDAGDDIRDAFLAGRRGDEGIGRRDRHMAGEIRRLCGGCSGSLVHIGGWVHLVADRRRETLYSLLEDLDPRRLLLEH